MRKLKIFSFFAGCGILDLGFETNGFEVAFVNERSKGFMAAHAYARERMGIPEPECGRHAVGIEEFLEGRASEMDEYMADTRADGSLVGFVGGPPCPDFSVAGKQRGRDGDNGRLSLSYVEAIARFRPDFFLFENVKGLYTTARHRAFFENLKEVLVAAGYVLTERLTNALEFGVPQDRSRIFLFGVRRELDFGADFPWTRYASFDMGDIAGMPWPTTDPFGNRPAKPEGVPEELTVRFWFRKNSVETHPNAGDRFRPRAGLAKMETVAEGDDSRKSYKRLHRWRYSPTVAYGNNEVHLHPYEARRLSVAEAMALQSLPKEFVLPPGMSLTAKFKTVGNGVPYLLAGGIAKSVRDHLERI